MAAAKDNVPSGFSLTYCNDDVGLYLPILVAEEVEAKKAIELELAEGEEKKRRAEERARRDAELAEKQRNREERDSGKTAEEQVAEALAGDTENRLSQNEVLDPLTQAIVYTAEETSMFEERIKRTHDTDQKASLRRTYADLVKRGGIRRIAAPADMSSLDKLAEAHPNFIEVIDLVRNELLASRRAGRPVQIPALLLLGGAGIGKSHLATALAATLGAPIHRINFDAPVSASALIGLDKQWSNTKTGLLFDVICRGEFANPVMLLDELDKARVLSGDDPLSPLHTLLEPSTAGAAKDISVEFAFNAKHVVWIATANHALLIPQTIRSRFTEFTISLPSPAQAISVTAAVAAAAIGEAAPAGFQDLDRRLVVALAHCTPREVLKAVTGAVSRAVVNDRSHITREDFPADIFAEDPGDGPKDWLH